MSALDAAELLARCIRDWPPEVRAQCLGLPRDEDPIAELLSLTHPGGAEGPVVALAYGLSKQRVHQIEQRTLAKLVWPALSGWMRGARVRGRGHAHNVTRRAA